MSRNLVVSDALANSSQLTLEIRLADEATFESFRPSEALIPLVSYLIKVSELAPGAAPGAIHDSYDAATNDDDQEGGPVEPGIAHFFHGPEASGKSHLLQAACRERPGALYLPVSMVRDEAATEVLKSLELSPFVALDELDLIAGREEWEEGLFHFLNRAAQAGCVVYAAARRPPTDSGFILPDLVSRLAVGTVWAFPAPSEEERLKILSHRASARGLALPEPVIAYLCRRGGRSLEDLLGALDILDEASLQFQRPLTVPFVRRTLGWE
ncbi:MAG: DnaA/Hda family protein [Pseudomonadota bacterium]